MSKNQSTKLGAAFELFSLEMVVEVAVCFFIYRVKVVPENQTISATTIAQNAPSHYNFRNFLSCVAQTTAGVIQILQRILRIPNASQLLSGFFDEQYYIFV